MRRIWIAAAAALLLSACVTAPKTPAPIDYPGAGTPDVSDPSIPTDPTDPYRPPVAQPSEPNPTQPNPTGPITRPDQNNASVFAKLPHWQTADMQPALTAFERSCGLWAKKKASTLISASHPEMGRVSDWREPCDLVQYVGQGPQSARNFFQAHFYPLYLSGGEASGTDGLLTAYYQPEITVRRKADTVFSEPILTVPAKQSHRALPRAKIRTSHSSVIAYGRPIDVFFMQIQGSGVLAFEDGRRTRAAFAAHNGQPYTSIGGVLVKAGYMTKDQASKQAIEKWMADNGPEATRMLINENERYVYFEAQNIVAGEGPNGAMGVPLTAMGSMAVDPAFHPYGMPFWITVKTPQFGGDYNGKETGLLMIAQDTGGAIKGMRRGDLYFGSGFEAGDRAGVMKHKGQWAILLPRALLRGLAVS
ncbi:MAG: MltA domain-containing protein [Alphaproteobacteria bacterium]